MREARERREKGITLWSDIKCAKCKNKCKGGANITEAGNSYMFCFSCADILEKFTKTGNVVHNFLS